MERSRVTEIVLRAIRSDSRRSLSELSRERDIPLQALLAASRNIEKSGVVRYASLIDPRQIGYSIRVNYLLKERTGGVRGFLGRHKSINNCSRLMDEGMFYAECFFRDMKELDDFREALDELGAKIVDEAFVTEELKREGVMCDL